MLRLITITISSLSCLCNLLILITCHSHLSIGKTLSRQLIYYQTVADLLGNISYITFSPYFFLQCNILGLFVFIANMSCVFWTVIISYVLQMVTNTHRTPIFKGNLYFHYYHFFSWIIPIILSLLAYTKGLSSFLPSFSFSYFPCFINLLFNIIFSIFVILEIRWISSC